MRRPSHALRHARFSESDGDGRESLASEATGRTSSLAESLTFTRSLALDPDLVRGVAGDEVLRGLGRMFHASAPASQDIEFALFCGENEDGALVFLPVGRALTAVAFFLGFGVLRDLGEWAQGGVSFAGVLYGLNMTAVVVYACHTQLAFLAQVERIEHDLRNFSLAKAECSDERDRQHVERVIEKCWAKRGGVAGFERSVRSGPIYDALQRAVGRYGLLRYFDVVVATLGVLFLFVRGVRFPSTFIRHRRGSSMNPRRGLGLHAHNAHDVSHAITTVSGVFIVMPLAFAGHAKFMMVLGRVAMPYGCKLALASFAFVACVLSLSLVNFELGREFCRATVGYGCLRG